VDIRAAAAFDRGMPCQAWAYGVWGTCYGDGRTLEAASAWYPGGLESYYNDAFSSRPPPLISPLRPNSIVYSCW
jgi:hypothetical protein